MAEHGEDAPPTPGLVGTLGGISVVTKLLLALAGLISAGSAAYVAMPKSAPPVSSVGTALTAVAVPQPPTRSYIQLASFGNLNAATAAARRQATDLLRHVCVYESRGAYATALGPMLTADADDMVKAIAKHPTVHVTAYVVPGKTYVSTGTCFGGAQ